MTGKDTLHQGLPVPGYQPQSRSAVGLVSEHKRFEENLLRHLDRMKDNPEIDQRWLAIGRTGIETAFMAINRAVFKPTRAQLPDDPTTDDPEEPGRAGPPPYAAA